MKYLAPLVIIISILLLMGAGCEEQSATGAVVMDPQKEVVCDSPYIRHGEDCCLDKNFNNICDEDEKTEFPEPQITTIVEDACTSTTYFDCWGSYITKDEIYLKLRANHEGYNVIRKIELPSIGCEKEFEPIPKEQGLEIRDIIEVRIPCKISTTYFKELEYTINSVYYLTSGDTTEWLGKETRGTIISSGTLSGTVRDKLPETI